MALNRDEALQLTDNAQVKEAIKMYYKASHIGTFKPFKDRADFEQRIERIMKEQEKSKAKREKDEEKKGSYKAFNKFCSNLIEGDKFYSYKKLQEIIEAATAERQEGLAKRRELEEKLAELDAQYGFVTKKKK